MKRQKNGARRVGLTAALTVFLSLVGVQAEASWWIEPQRFHASTHGQTSCQDCHPEISGQALHPNPANVNKARQTLFARGGCFACHDNVMDELKKGMHGTRAIRQIKDYDACLDCHSPHVEIRQSDRDQIDPSKPIGQQCGACHDNRKVLPPLFAEDMDCMRCHEHVDDTDPRNREKVARFCLHCHAKSGRKPAQITGEKVPLIKEEAYQSSTHAETACTLCHTQSAQFGHANQGVVLCIQCHSHHDASIAHDTHMAVTCQACHLDGVRPLKDPVLGVIGWEKVQERESESRIHHMVHSGHEGACRRCHYERNNLGAVSMILPPKSVLCMPCHAATFSFGDTTTILSLLVFFVGLVLLSSTWLSGTVPGMENSRAPAKLVAIFWRIGGTLFSRRMGPVLRTLVMDALFQRRLFRQSPKRWLIHGFIFFPVVFRFLWGVVALTGSLWRPEAPFVWFMLDKNHPLTAFLLDLTGLMVIIGVLLAAVRGIKKRRNSPSGLPGQDLVALSLMAGVVLVGFLVEGMRIAMTGYPAGAAYAFLGFAVSLLFSNVEGLTELYGFPWYAHVILTGALIAYLPFSRLIHVMMAPVMMAVNASGGKNDE